VAFPANTLDRIQKEIQQYGINCGNMMKQFTNIYNNKYSHKDAINEDYSQKEEFKGIGTDELLYMQQKKLEGQDEQIAEITLDVKKNTVLAKNVGHVIKEQNVKLEEINEDIDEEIEIFFNTLNAEDFKNLSSAPEIKYNFETMNEILDPLRDTENEFQNPNLKITKTVRSKVQIIIPKKELNEENSNLIKDILKFQEGYELNAEESNKTIEKVKDNFKELSDSVTQLIKLIEDIKSRYFEHAKEMMAPMIKKNEDFAKIEKNQ